ncbi:DUF1761 domain-containing protein [Candidatus Parcubacteria bacterium]|nr:DUF1761 domain-containing protein [Candidatus Parcubacteria bacterium]
MGVPINYWAVLVATLVNIVLGFLWYGPIFGKKWRRLMGMTIESMEKMKAKGMTQSYVLMIVGALVMNYVLAHALVFGMTYTGMYGVVGGMTGAFYYWLGFAAPLTLSSVMWEGKSWKLWFIDAGYYLVALLIAGAIFGYWV